LWAQAARRSAAELVSSKPPALQSCQPRRVLDDFVVDLLGVGRRSNAQTFALGVAEDHVMRRVAFVFIAAGVLQHRPDGEGRRPAYAGRDQL
jgi:hypothetical protein